ncbi:hypothetical protein B0H14DRAFT_2651193 [Mycena olivaceomarginata]|nr:hypothetical protein B0H14DRAFT_2651193 [Mycena olivaceomarginata]
MEQHLTTHDLASQYTFHRPKSIREPKIPHTLTGIKYVLNDSGRFPPTHSIKSKSPPSILSCRSVDSELKQRWVAVMESSKTLPSEMIFNLTLSGLPMAYAHPVSITGVPQHVQGVVPRLPRAEIREHSWKYHGVPGNYIDIVKSVINTTMCGLSVKNNDNPRGLYTEQEIYDMFIVLSTYISNFIPSIPLLKQPYSHASIGNEEPENAFHLRWAVAQVAVVLQPRTTRSFLSASPEKSRVSLPADAESFSEYHTNNAFSTLVSHLVNLFGTSSQKPCHPFLDRLLESGRLQNQLVANVIGLAVASVNHARAAVHVDFYLDDARAHERRQIIKLLRSDDELDRDDVLNGYLRLMINPECGGHWRDVTANTVIPQGVGRPAMVVSAGDRIWMSLKNANLNWLVEQPLDFARPTAVAPMRSIAPQKLKGCLGLIYADQTITEIIKVVFALKNLRRAPGTAGRLARFKSNCNETATNTYLTPDGKTSRWPGSMHLVMIHSPTDENRGRFVSGLYMYMYDAGM